MDSYAYNHQPQGVDASGLKLDGTALGGKVKVSIAPDCYRPPERFTLEYDLDAVVADDAVVGTFTGIDRGNRVGGAITGELRPKRTAAAPITMPALAQCELKLGYCLVRGPAPKRDWESYPMNHANVRFTCAGGKVTAVEVFNPYKAETFTTTIANSDLRIDGDRLTASVAFELSSKVIEGGRYAFEAEAIVDGDSLIGFWRGTHNGKDILTKSAKLSGSVSSAPPKNQ